MTIILVAGTWGYRGIDHSAEWWNPAGPFAQMLQGLGHRVLGAGPNERPYVWTTNVNGAYACDQFMDWRAGGAGLYEYAVPSVCPTQRVPPSELAVIAHSHGLQVVRFAAEAGLEIARLVSVMSPIRPDVEAMTPHARSRVASWTHLYSDLSDAWQIAGEDPLHVQRTAPQADRNVFVPGVGHTGVLTAPDVVQWKGWLS